MNPSKPTTIVCLGAGKQQLPLLKKASDMGFVTIAIDRDPDAPGFVLTDKSVIQSTHGSKNIELIFGELKQSFDIVAVLNRSSGPPVSTATGIAATLGLPGVTSETARTILNKDLFRGFCLKNGIPVPQYMVIDNQTEIPSLNLSFPVIVKPALSLVGKGGIQKIRGQEDIQQAVQHAFDHTINGKVLIEEFIEGDDVSLLSVVKNKVLHPVAIIDEINRFARNQRLEPFAMIAPSKYQTTIGEQRLLALAERLKALCGLDNTPFNLACRFDANGQPYVIECHLDISGDAIYDELLPAASGFEGLEFIIDCICNSNCSVELTYSKVTAVRYGKERSNISIITAQSRDELDRLIDE